MSETCTCIKKGKNFKEIIIQEKNKGKTFKRTMKVLTGIDSSVLYGGSFLLTFVALDALAYYLLSPSVLSWTALLMGTAFLSSIAASKIANRLKKQQWRYAA